MERFYCLFLYTLYYFSWASYCEISIYTATHHIWGGDSHVINSRARCPINGSCTLDLWEEGSGCRQSPCTYCNIPALKASSDCHNQSVREMLFSSKDEVFNVSVVWKLCPQWPYGITASSSMKDIFHCFPQLELTGRWRQQWSRQGCGVRLELAEDNTHGNIADSAL